MMTLEYNVTLLKIKRFNEGGIIMDWKKFSERGRVGFHTKTGGVFKWVVYLHSIFKDALIHKSKIGQINVKGNLRLKPFPYS